MKQTLASFPLTPAPSWGSAPKVRMWAEQQFRATTGELHPAGEANYEEIVLTPSGDGFTFPSTEVDTTDDSSDPNATYSAAVYNGNKQVYTLFDRWVFRASLGTTISWDDLETSNVTRVPLRDDTAYSKVQSDLRMASILNVGNPATTAALGRVKASATPSDAANPTAIVEGDGRAGKSSANYASLSAAVSSIGATPTDLYVVNAFPSGASCTVPLTLTLRFVRGGSIVLGAGHTVTINGPVVAEPVQIFSGTGLVRFTSNKTAPVFYAHWWGCVGDWDTATSTGTDDSAALNAALAALPDYSTFSSAGLHMRVNTTARLFDRRGIRWVGAGTVGGAADASDSSSIAWGGAAGGTILSLSHVRDSLFESLFVDSESVADVGVHLRGDEGGANISSKNVFRHFKVLGRGARANFVGVLIGGVGGQNDEFHSFEHTVVIASGQIDMSLVAGTAFKILHSNVKGIVLSDVSITGAAVGVHNISGSFQAKRVHGTFNQIAYKIQGNSDPVSIEGDVWETVRQILVVSGTADSPIHIKNLNVGAFSAGFGSSSFPLFDFGSSAQVSFEGVELDANSFTDIFKGNDSSRVFSRNDNWGNDGSEIGHRTIGKIKAEGSGYPFGLRETVASIGGHGTRNPHYGLIADSGSIRKVFGTVNDSATAGATEFASEDTLLIADGAIEISGPHQPNLPKLTVVGTAGATTYSIAVVALDSVGNKTLISKFNTTSTANATLTGSNYIQVDWPAVPGAASYDVLERDGGTYRLIANTATNTYNITSNPGGAFTYTIPTFNEAANLLFRGQVSLPNTFTFADADATPSVGKGNDFTASNTGATSITTFDDGAENQIITILFTNGNTTLVNGATLKLAGAANFVGSADDMIVLKKRSTVWYEVSRSVN